MAIEPSSSSYSDCFDNDEEFLEALRTVVLPGDVEEPATPVKSNKRKHESESPSPQALQAESSNAKPQVVDVALDDYNTYGPSKFGDFGEYMRRKRAKLQIQDADIRNDQEEATADKKIFQGLAIYINGWTQPSIQELRKLIVENGGTYHTFMDRKSLVTHIVTCSLTPAKIRDWKHMKIVTPSWLVESARAGVLLSWRDFIFKPGDRIEAAQGRQVAQRSIFDSMSTFPKPESSKSSNTSVVKDDKSGRNISPVPMQSISSPRTPTNNASPASVNILPGATTPTPLGPIYTNDPITRTVAARVPGYFADSSNINAAKAMRSEDWRVAHTSAAGADFIDGYYKNSRLHHLSMWKAELKELVREAQEKAEAAFNESDGLNERTTSGSDNLQITTSTTGQSVSMRGATLTMRSPDKGKGKVKADEPGDNRIIMHCDFDCFFASVGLLDRPQLRGKPVVVCHSQGSQGGSSSTSEIASSSYEARKFGIKNGMSLQQARRLCPEILTVPYEFEKYKQISLQFYTILMGYADDLQAVSVDEALIDVSSRVERMQESSKSANAAKELAEIIRADVFKKTGCQVSIGVAHNIMMARLATRRAKPAGSYHLLPADIPTVMADLNVDDLHGFGYAARDKIQEKFGTSNLGKLARKSKTTLCDALGTASGERLYDAIRGIDRKILESDKPRKSVSAEINYGIRFKDQEEAKEFIYKLATEVSKRLQAIKMLGKSLTLKIMKRSLTSPTEPPKFMGHGICDVFNKQAELSGLNRRATSDPNIIGDCAWNLLKGFSFDPKELRGVGIQIQRLETEDGSSGKEQGQAKLMFKPVDHEAMAIISKFSSGRSRSMSTSDMLPQITVQPPSQDQDVEEVVVKDSIAELPSFSQVDRSVFDSLPEGIRQELQMEYDRMAKSKSPKTPNKEEHHSPDVSSSKTSYKAQNKVQNLSRITRQLAPRSRPNLSPNKSPKKHPFFDKMNERNERTKKEPVSADTSDAELEEFGIDPVVFRALPADLRREQLAGARFVKSFGNDELLGPPKVLKRYKLKMGKYYRPPKPMAKFVEPARLRQRSAGSNEKLYLTETEDVQTTVEAWVDKNQNRAPNKHDIEYFSKFLLQCVDSTKSTDTGIEKAIAIMKWWLVILRRRWKTWEHATEPESKSIKEEPGSTSEFVARAWWNAFWEVKHSLDVVVRKKFGGSLSIK